MLFNLIPIVLGVLVCVSQADVVQQVNSIFQNSMAAQHANPPSGYPGAWLRQAHAKQHGCLRAVVHVEPSLPASFAQGVFQPGASYPAFMRFSNGVGRGFAAPPVVSNASDISPDTRGLALKLFNVSGSFLMPDNSSQAFTFTTSRRGFLPTPQSAVDYFTAVQKGALAISAFLLENPGIAALYSLLGIDGAISDVLSPSYWTAPAQMMGPTAAKFHIAPCAGEMDRILARRQLQEGRPNPFADLLDRNYLRDNLISDVFVNLPPNEEIRLCWSAQLYQDEESTPIDDTTIQWNTPFTQIAQIAIGHQYAWSDGQDAFCRHMSFNPFLGLVDHKPVGFLQDIRGAVYGNGAAQRHSLLQQPSTFASYENWVDYPYY